MKHNKTTRFQQFLRWAEGPPPETRPEVEQDPERQEFLEYLEYLDAHEHIDFGAYRLMRYRERAARGMDQSDTHAHTPQGQEPPRHTAKARRAYRPGQLRRQIRLYRLLSAVVVGVVLSALLLVVLHLPGFGQGNTVNTVAQRYLERGIEETGAVNAVAGMILDYRAFDTFGEATVLFAAALSVMLLLQTAPAKQKAISPFSDYILQRAGRVLIPFIMLFGFYVVLNGHLSPGGGFSGGTVLGCGLILSAFVLGQDEMERLLPMRRLTAAIAWSLLVYGLMKGYSFFTGANHIGWEIPKGTPGRLLSAGFLVPLNLCVGIVVACTMYAFYILFAGKEQS